MNIQTLKGFRDFLPKEAKKRQYVLDILRKVFESYGFEPLETPALEYEEVLTGKYGDEGEKLMYKFEDRGGRKVALRYDQTVPLARVVAQYENELPMPFKRYQIQPVWRAENTQKGRYREFLQVDIDTVGTASPLSDAEVIEVATKSIEELGIKKFKILVNDRSVFSKLPKEAITIIDKLKKIGREKVKDELSKKNINVSILSSIESIKPTERIREILSILNNPNVEFSPTLARGLDYYTGIIFEVEVEGYESSIAGGGRYDKLIGMFSGKDIPAVGFSFGFDRLIEAMDELKLFPKDIEIKSVLITIFSPELMSKSIGLINDLRSKNINCELYLDDNASLEKQLKYADKKRIRFAVIIGPKEVKNGTVMLKDLKNKIQKEVKIETLATAIKDAR